MPVELVKSAGTVLLRLNIKPVVPEVTVIVPVGVVQFGCVTFAVSVAGFAFTVMVNCCDGPGQLFAVGVTVTVAVTFDAPAFRPVKDAILPEPLAPRPIEVVLLVQPKVVPVTVPVKFTAETDAPAQIV